MRRQLRSITLYSFSRFNYPWYIKYALLARKTSFKMRNYTIVQWKFSISCSKLLWIVSEIVNSTLYFHPLAFYQIRSIAGCACTGDAGNVFPHRRLQRKPLLKNPGIHHGTCVTHVPWCMSGSLAPVGGENVPAISAHAHPQFPYLAKGPFHNIHGLHARYLLTWYIL